MPPAELRHHQEDTPPTAPLIGTSPCPPAAGKDQCHCWHSKVISLQILSIHALIYDTIVQIKHKPNKMEATGRKVDNLNNK